MRGAWLHVMGDLLGSVVAIAAGVLILAFGWTWTDAGRQFSDFPDYHFRRVEFNKRIGQRAARRHARAH
jgi:hypothetical protein